MYLPYIYKLTDKVTGMWYIGSRISEREQCCPEELGVRYFTSSEVVAPLFREDPERFTKEIVVTSEDYEYIIHTEVSMLTFRDAKNDPMSYNMHNGDGKMNTKKAGKLGGSISGKVTGPINGEKLKLEKRGVCAEGSASKGGKIGIKKITKEIRSLAGKKGGSIVGAKNGKLNGEANVILKRGWFKEETRSKAGKAGAKVLNSLKCKCLECEMVSNPGAIGRHQKFKNHNGKEYL